MFLDLIRSRRSIRKYEDKPIEPEKLDALLEAGLRSPSSMGTNPWEFIVVKDRAVLEKLSQAKPHGSSFLKNAPLCLVVCADPAKSTVWIEDASIASLMIHLAAASLGLGSCWIQIRDRMHNQGKSSEAYISEILHIPEHIKVEAMIAIGYPAENKPGHARESLPGDKVHYGAYGNRKPA